MQSCVGSYEVGKYLGRVKSPLLPTINRGRGMQKLIRCFDVANGKINVSFVFSPLPGQADLLPDISNRERGGRGGPADAQANPGNPPR
jgi:hypothetical protein